MSQTEANMRIEIVMSVISKKRGKNELIESQLSYWKKI